MSKYSRRIVPVPLQRVNVTHPSHAKCSYHLTNSRCFMRKQNVLFTMHQPQIVDHTKVAKEIWTRVQCCVKLAM